MEDYNQIDRQLHLLCQIIAKANRTYVQKVDDDVDAIAQAAGANATLPVTLTDQRGNLTRYEIRMKGPMVTPTLQGIIGNGPFHWRGDRAAVLHPAVPVWRRGRSRIGVGPPTPW